MKYIAITGASGYIGRNLSISLCNLGYSIISFYWKNTPSHPGKKIALKIDSNTEWKSNLSGVSCVIHLASIVHSSDRSRNDYIEVNTFGTLNLAEQAIKSGVKRFIYISSISVNGDSSGDDTFKSSDYPNPSSSYSISKNLAEIGLIKLAEKNPNFELIIIRPSMVYGYGAPGNFSNLISWAKFNLPFPALSRSNIRTFLHIENLVQLIGLCTSSRLFNNINIFLAADPVGYSTYDFTRYACKSSGYKFWTIQVPRSFIKFFFIFTKKKNLFSNLYTSLKIDISDAINVLGWKPIDFIGNCLNNSPRD